MSLILVVDDELDACLLMQRVLSGSGHEVYALQDPREAMVWLQTHEPDLALLDIKLRGGDGISVLEHLRRSHTHTKVMMITGYPSVETASRALELGIDDYLVKPLEIDELEQRVNKALGLIL
jgi:DNA-binding response OmpR family regulator